MTSFPPVKSVTFNFFSLPSPRRILGKWKQEHLIFSPDVLITEGPHMCTHSWIFLDFYRLQSSNCFFTLRCVAAVGRCSAKAAEAEADGRGLGTENERSPSSLTQWHSQKLLWAILADGKTSVPESSLASKRKPTTALCDLWITQTLHGRHLAAHPLKPTLRHQERGSRYSGGNIGRKVRRCASGWLYAQLLFSTGS